ncbi:hypothetical protein FQR65_LT01838 [Abscondita terminalis]|nr:hypothetical protein FQR65_LT01838 [Abscondita terminalis]
MIWLIVVSAILFLFLYYKAIKSLNYWKDRGIPHLKPLPILGNFAPVTFQKISIFDQLHDWYHQFPKERYFGIHQFITPVLMLRDLDLIKKITVTDFEYFIDHNSFINEEVDPLLGKSLMALKGQRWRDMRATLTPVFTSSKIKTMFPLIVECAEEFTQCFQKQKSEEFDMKDIFSRFTNDVIATTAFGLKCNSLRDKNNEFYLMGKKLTTFTASTFFILNFTAVFPKLAKFLNLSVVPKSAADFFSKVIKDTLRKREKEGLIRHDMIQLIMEARKQRNRDELKLTLTDEDITAQALLFFFGGFESASALMTFFAYELAFNYDIQERLQEEIDQTLKDCSAALTFETLINMKYLDMVIYETLRKWPLGFVTDRLCVKDYMVKPVNAFENGVLIEKGTNIQIPIVGIHRDPKYFPDPEKFDPERFNDDNRHVNFYLPFGSGPRSCIASRFAFTEVKTLMFHLLHKFDLVRVEKTLFPMEIAKSVFNVVPAKSIWLKIRPRWNKSILDLNS